MNIKRLIRDAGQVVYASAKVFSNSEDANKFLEVHKEYRVVPNAVGTPDTYITVALDNDEGIEE
jgi:hypothetical protein